MDNQLILTPIAYIRTEFPSKFGIPRQSGLADIRGRIVFEPDYRNPEIIRGMESYSHLWLLWGFSENISEGWHPTVRPPRLGGNTRVGVFATRSPYRPNPVGLSCVELDRIEMTDREGPILYVTGVDMMDGTPVYDIKPYLPYVDCHLEASGGFSERKKEYHLKVDISEECLACVPEEKRSVLIQILSQDPRPSYHHDPDRIYGMEYAGMEVRFSVENEVLHVREILYTDAKNYRYRQGKE